MGPLLIFGKMGIHVMEKLKNNCLVLLRGAACLVR